MLRTLASVPAGDTPPFLTVYLSGGHVVGGGLVTVDADRGNDVVVLADPEPFQDLLTGGRVPLPPPGAPVSRLALQREFTPSEGFPVDVDWAALDGSGLMASHLASLLHGLRDAVTQVCAGDMGRRAWAQVRTLRVEHRAGSPLSVQSLVDGLRVQADLSGTVDKSPFPGEVGGWRGEGLGLEG